MKEVVFASRGMAIINVPSLSPPPPPPHLNFFLLFHLFVCLLLSFFLFLLLFSFLLNMIEFQISTIVFLTVRTLFFSFTFQK